MTSNQISGEIRGVYIYPNDYPIEDYRNKILIWGRFFFFSGSEMYTNLARLNSNGSLDTTFPLLNSYNGAVNTVASAGPGFGGAGRGPATRSWWAVITCVLASEETGPAYQLVRLNYDGAPDSRFTHWGAPGGYVNSIRVYLNDPTYGNNVRLLCT